MQTGQAKRKRQQLEDDEINQLVQDEREAELDRSRRQQQDADREVEEAQHEEFRSLEDANLFSAVTGTGSSGRS